MIYPPIKTQYKTIHPRVKLSTGVMLINLSSSKDLRFDDAKESILPKCKKHTASIPWITEVYENVSLTDKEAEELELPKKKWEDIIVNHTLNQEWIEILEELDDEWGAGEFDICIVPVDVLIALGQKDCRIDPYAFKGILPTGLKNVYCHNMFRQTRTHY